MPNRIVVLGAGFGGLELATLVSEALGNELELTLIDKADSFVFGYSKLDVMFGRTTAEAVRLPYADVDKPGVRFARETVIAIDPVARRVTTDAGVHDADILVIALGADYDYDATPGLAEGGNEFYSVAGADRLAEVLPSSSQGRAIIGVCGAPFKCPPAPSEAALLLHDHLSQRGVRERLRDLARDAARHARFRPRPIPRAALARGLRGARHRVRARTPRRARSTAARSVAVLDDGGELPYDLFLGVPKHRAPDVVVASGMTDDGYVPVDPRTLETRFPGVYAVGDVRTRRRPKSRRVRRGRGAHRRRRADRASQRRRAPRRLRRARLLLHRVRRRTRRPRRRRLPLGAEADGHLPGALRRTRAEKERLRLQPPRTLVRPLSQGLGRELDEGVALHPPPGT